MGVLNVTPDSFSDGGRFLAPDQALEQARRMIAEGADLLDIGGESTRPGSDPVPADEQIRRVVPVIERIRAETGTLISVDTTSSKVAAAALDGGADIVNDISGGEADPDLLPLIASRGVPVVLMHMRGTPKTMQSLADYNDVVAEVRAHLASRRDAAVAAGVAPKHILLDPGIGFGKNLEHNLLLLRDLKELAALGQPLLVGTSRKRFVGTITDEPEPERRVFGTAATVAWSVANGAAIVRVHDVRAMAQVVRMTEAIRSGNWTPPG